MNTNKSLRAKIMVAVAAAVLVLSSIACDNGGTVNPDSGCYGQGANYESCVETVNATGDIINNAVEQVVP